eukprot:11833051-Karenia_brevis.AAC.1
MPNWIPNSRKSNLELFFVEMMSEIKKEPMLFVANKAPQHPTWQQRNFQQQLQGCPVATAKTRTLQVHIRKPTLVDLTQGSHFQNSYGPKLFMTLMSP